MKLQQISEPNNKIIRYTHANGIGLLNNSGLDRMKLSDDEENELMTLMDYGLQQPPMSADINGVFYFTEIGEKKHARMIELLIKASKTRVRRSEAYYKGKPNWESADGQIAIDPSLVINIE